MKRRYRLNAQQQGWMEDMAVQTHCLRNDWMRRLRNALMVLAGLDPQWMIWVERELPSPSLGGLPFTARLVEARARALLLKQYRYLGMQAIGDLIFKDWPFNDDGNLTPG